MNLGEITSHAGLVIAGRRIIAAIKDLFGLLRTVSSDMDDEVAHALEYAARMGELATRQLFGDEVLAAVTAVTESAHRTKAATGAIREAVAAAQPAAAELQENLEHLVALTIRVKGD